MAINGGNDRGSDDFDGEARGRRGGRAKREITGGCHRWRSITTASDLSGKRWRVAIVTFRGMIDTVMRLPVRVAIRRSMQDGQFKHSAFARGLISSPRARAVNQVVAKREPDRTGLGLAASLKVLDIHIFVASKREGYFTMSHTVTMSWVRSSQRSLWLPTAKL